MNETPDVVNEGTKHWFDTASVLRMVEPMLFHHKHINIVSWRSIIDPIHGHPIVSDST